MGNKFKLLVISLALIAGLFLFLGYSSQAEDSSGSYGYVPKYKDESIYTYDPSKTETQYQLGQPARPPALSERIAQPGNKWSRPEDLSSQQEFYKPPTEVFGPFTFMKEEEKIETRKGNLTTEAFAEELVPIIEAATGKQPKLGITTEEEAALSVSPIVPVEDEEEKAGENPPQDKKKDEWELLFNKGRVNLKAPSGTSEEDLTAIASSLADFLGRGGEVSLTPEGIEIVIK